MASPRNSGGREGDRFPSPASAWAIAYCDGGSRGNPGPAGFGVYIEDEAGKVLAELSEYLGVRTNNFAEYSGLLAALKFAIAHGHPRLRLISDSELMVKQMKGQYRVKSPELRPLYEEAKSLALKLERFEIQHVLRESNRHADRLANLGMDRGMGRVPSPADSGTPLKRQAKALAPELKIPEPKMRETKMLRGLVKGGVVHLIGCELPDGIFVKVLPE